MQVINAKLPPFSDQFSIQKNENPNSVTKTVFLTEYANLTLPI